MKPRPPFVDFVIEQFGSLGEATVRAMMGGWVVYIDGAVCALIADNELYLKADTVSIPEFDARGLRAFKPFEDSDMVMKYYQAPPEIFDDHDALTVWVGKALAASRRAKPKTRKPTAAKKSPRPSSKRAR